MARQSIGALFGLLGVILATYFGFSEGQAQALPTCAVTPKWFDAPLPRGELREATLLVRTSKNNLARLEVRAGDTLLIKRLQLFAPDGSSLLDVRDRKIRSTYTFDVDTGWESREDADLWWRAPSAGRNILEPMGNVAIAPCGASAVSGGSVGTIVLPGAPSAPTSSADASLNVQATTGMIIDQLAPRDPSKKWNGQSCQKGAECQSGHCADGKRCAPKDGTGQVGQYCHHNNHCSTGTCSCRGDTKPGGFCQNWEAYSDREVLEERAKGGFECRSKASEGAKACLVDSGCDVYQECKHYRCVTKPGEEFYAEYFRRNPAFPCTEDYQCDEYNYCDKRNNLCMPIKGAPHYKADGSQCTRNAQCVSENCADKRFCAPKDRTGPAGNYCHHNNHCSSGTCACPNGRDILGFCVGYENGTNKGVCQ